MYVRGSDLVSDDHQTLESVMRQQASEASDKLPTPYRATTQQQGSMLTTIKDMEETQSKLGSSRITMQMRPGDEEFLKQLKV